MIRQPLAAHQSAAADVASVRQRLWIDPFLQAVGIAATVMPTQTDGMPRLSGILASVLLMRRSALVGQSGDGQGLRCCHHQRVVGGNLAAGPVADCLRLDCDAPVAASRLV